MNKGIELRPRSKGERYPTPLVASSVRIGGGSAGLMPNSGVISLSVSLTSYLIALGVLNSGLSVGTRFSVLGAMFVAIGLLGLRGFWGRWRTQRLLDRVPCAGSDKIADGTRVRIRGVAWPRVGTFRSVIGREVLVARYIGSRGRFGRLRWLQRPRWELHAVDFDVEMDGGERVWVRVSHLVFLPHPPPTARQTLPIPAASTPNTGERSWIYREDLLAPGDVVELAGTLHVASDPRGRVAFDRQPRLVSVLEGDDSSPILLRTAKPGALVASNAGPSEVLANLPEST